MVILLANDGLFREALDELDLYVHPRDEDYG